MNYLPQSPSGKLLKKEVWRLLVYSFRGNDQVTFAEINSHPTLNHYIYSEIIYGKHERLYRLSFCIKIGRFSERG